MNVRGLYAFICNLLIFFASAGCVEDKSESKLPTVLHLTIQNAYNQLIIVERKGLFGERDSVILQARPVNRVEDLHLPLSDTSERLYQVRSGDARVISYFINDADTIHVFIDYLEPKNISFVGSPATTSLNGYFKSVQEYGARTVRGATPFGGITTSPDMNKMAYQYVDTTSSPAAALMVFNSIDFGRNYSAIETFVTRLAARFPDAPGIKELKIQTIEYLKIFQKDLTVGDRAPELSLPDSNRVMHTILFDSHRLTLIDVCSSWYSLCRLRYQAMKQLSSEVNSNDLQLVSVSLDMDEKDWKQLLRLTGANWLQLRDSLIWQGPTLQQYLFDSIPYNFIVARDGLIVAKAVPTDSIRLIVRQLLKRRN